jgi:hypothetical protein
MKVGNAISQITAIALTLIMHSRLYLSKTKNQLST